MLFFDCSLDAGEYEFSTTVVAERGTSGFGFTQYAPDFETECVDPWNVVVGSERLLLEDEIDGLISGLSTALDPTRVEKRS